MGTRNMKTNIYQKLHTAACEARGVVKGKKVPGMQFNPLLHDEVQKVAMERSEKNTYELQSQSTNSYAVFRMKKKK